MNLRILFFIVLFCLSVFKMQGQNTIQINYHSRFPFSIHDSLSPSGIEIDIVNEYLLWLKTNKKLDFQVVYKSFPSIHELMEATKNKNINSISMGAFISSSDRSKDLDYAVPFLKNVSFCVTNGNAPDIKNRTANEVTKGLGVMSAVTIENTNLHQCVKDIKKIYLKDLKITFENNQTELLNAISKNVLVFGYVDAIEFWFYLKNNPTKFLKIQKSMEETKESYSYAFPKGSQHKALFDEFFQPFKSGPKYKAILEKYIGGFMAQNLSVK